MSHQPHQEEEHPPEDGEGNWIMSYADMMTLLVGFFALLYSFSQVDKQKFEKVREEVSKQFGGKFESPFEELHDAIKKVIAENHLEDRVKVEKDASGLAIIFQGSVFFDSGGVEVKEDSRPTLDEIVRILQDKAKGFPLFIEGHTDDAPIAAQVIASNWELSALRAARVVRIFEEAGVDHNLLSAQGFSDTKPLVPNRDPQGAPIAANQARNRRVVIKVTRG